MQVAAVQMCSTPDVAQNLDRAEMLLEQAAARGVQLAVLPEYFCAMGRCESDKLAHCDEPIQESLSGWAQKFGMWIIGGTISLRSPDAQRVFNSSLVFAPDGRCIARYDKIHLFRFSGADRQYDEAASIMAGTEPVCAQISEDWRVGLSVCYDLRFPELYRHYANEGANILVVPSAFTYATGQAHWELLLRARAIENQCYVIAAAQGGEHENGRRTWGQSMCIDPWGEVLSQCAPEENLAIANLSLERLSEVRSRLPALEHRQL